MDIPIHSEGIRDLIKRASDIVDRWRAVLRTKHSAHKEFIGGVIIKLLEGADITVALCQIAGDCGDNAASGATGAGENIVVCLLWHGRHDKCPLVNLLLD